MILHIVKCAIAEISQLPQLPQHNYNTRLMRDRDEIKAWLLDVLARTGETPTALARRAGVASSTLTRFLSREDSPLLSSTTIALINTAIENTGSSATTDAPGLPSHEATPFRDDPGDAIAAAVHALIAGRPATSAWVQKSDALQLRGILPGDVLIVDRGASAAPGAIACARAFDLKRSGSGTIFRVIEPPYLVATSLNPQWRKPLLIDNERVVLVGTVTHVLRAALVE